MAENIPPIRADDLLFAKVIASTIRNAMEDFHADGNLSDAQMAELNPIIRDAVVTALHAKRNLRTEQASRYLDFQLMLVPDYWEEPQLLDEYTEVWQMPRRTPAILCRNCSREIINITPTDRPRWKHLAADGGLSTGCRAASFTPSEGWDESLDRKLVAQPPKTNA